MMLEIFKSRLPEGVTVTQSKKRGDKYKLLLEYQGTEYTTELRTICPPNEENNICDYTLSVAMMAMALKRNDIELYRHWEAYQDSIFKKPKEKSKTNVVKVYREHLENEKHNESNDPTMHKDSETRTLRAMVSKPGGTASKGATVNYRISIPGAWAAAMGITTNDRELKCTFDGDKIIIAKSS